MYATPGRLGTYPSSSSSTDPVAEARAYLERWWAEQQADFRSRSDELLRTTGGALYDRLDPDAQAQIALGAGGSAVQRWGPALAVGALVFLLLRR